MTGALRRKRDDDERLQSGPEAPTPRDVNGAKDWTEITSKSAYPRTSSSRAMLLAKQACSRLRASLETCDCQKKAEAGKPRLSTTQKEEDGTTSEKLIGGSIENLSEKFHFALTSLGVPVRAASKRTQMGHQLPHSRRAQR